MTPDEFRNSLEGSLTATSSPTTYHHQYAPSPLDISHSQSINTIQSVRDYIITEELLAGQRLDGRMSSVRRFFCLFVTFDLLFVSLLWLICIMLNGENIVKALVEQIIHYNLKTSLFDIVIVTFCKFLVLLLFYALCYINHWIIIALTTTGTCAFLIGKVFTYDWPHSSQPVFEVVLVLSSFLLSWAEVWLFDFRVITQESLANRYLINTTESERAPLIRNYLQTSAPSQYTESVANFYSPLGTPEGSLRRFGETDGAYNQIKLSREEEEKYKHSAIRALDKAWDMVSKEDWKLNKEEGSDRLYVRTEKFQDKYYKLIAKINTAPKFLLDELYFRIEDLSKWNSSVIKSEKVQTINEHTDICYHISIDGAKGLITSRDFVTLRRWEKIDDCYVIASVKTEHPAHPVSKKYVRGETGVGCYMLEPVPDNDNATILTWILNTNLKILLPKSLLEKEIISIMFRTIKDFREYMSKH